VIRRPLALRAAGLAIGPLLVLGVLMLGPVPRSAHAQATGYGTLANPDLSRVTEENPANRESAADADRPRSTPGVSQAGPVDPHTYVLGPGDVLRLELWGRLVRSALLEVSPEGKIFLAGTGPVQVSGHTLEWAQSYVARKVGEMFRDVNCDLRLERVRRFRVFVSGEVARPGAVEVTPVTRASEAVSAAGLNPGASTRNITLRHRDGSAQRVDLQRSADVGRQEFDPTLLDGDMLVVPVATRFVYVKGAVARAARYDLAPGDSLSTLLELSGGLLPSAANDGALLVRFRAPTVRESLWLEVPKVLNGETDVPLQDGDQVFFFFTANFHDVPSVSIYGEVMRPGSYPITLGQSRLSELVRWGGGFTPMANAAAVILVRVPTDSAGKANAEFERLARMSRQEMTESEYAKFETRLSEQKNVFRVDMTPPREDRPATDPLLAGGDIVRVNPLVLSVRVEGEVRHPGLVDYVSGGSLGNYIDSAGGFTERAATGAVRVSRSLTGQVIPAASVRDIQPGDFIWVPERRDIEAWNIFRDVITVAAQLAVVVVAFRR